MISPENVENEIIAVDILKQRFSRLFEGVEPTTSASEYDATVQSGSLVVDALMRVFHRRVYRHQITKQTISKRVDDKKYLTGPYRTPTWGEIVAEHILEDVVIDTRNGELVEAKPEHFSIKLLDHHDWPKGSTMSNFAGTRTMSKDYTSTDIAFEYIFAPGQQTDKPTITSHIGPPIHIGDPNYPYFAYALKTAEEILCPEECAKPLDFNTIPKSHLRVLAQELISNKDIDELMRLKEHAQAYFEHTDHNPGYSGEWDYWEYAYLIDEINKGLLSIDSNNSSDQDTIVE